MYINLLILLLMASLGSGQPGKCDLTPPQAKVLEPSENKGYYHLSIDTNNNTGMYRPDQTYVLILESIGRKHPFRWFMITVEDVLVNTNVYDYQNKKMDLGSLKTLNKDMQSRYSERCYNSVENSDNSEKFRVEIHWVSPKETTQNIDQTIQLRAMVAENEEVWYVGDSLTLVLKKDNNGNLDSLPLLPSENCSLCSEARYEVIFKGQWSRMLHPRHYPKKPDENEYSELIGASHSYDYTLWQKGDKASPGLEILTVEADDTLLEREIINAMLVDNGTRTLIKGKRHRHPHMFVPSHSIFRVDRIHHLFSVVVAIKPSPDWFLGASRFELCSEQGWLEASTVPLYPWDAGVRDGISYESPTSVTTPVDTIDRVAVGSFDIESPFYQMNIDDLKPFAYLQVKRLEVYQLKDKCDEVPDLLNIQKVLYNRSIQQIKTFPIFFMKGTNFMDDQEQGDQAENLESKAHE